jgi:biopolymer transport protein TolR
MAFNTGKNHHKRHKRATISDINITPFVDVLLVLLIIFMVAAPMMTGSVEVNLPKGASSAISEKSDPISVTIKEDGSIYLQEENIKLRNLPARLLEITNRDLDAKIFVRADQKLDYGRVMEIVKATNSAGFTQVILVTELNGG